MNCWLGSFSTEVRVELVLIRLWGWIERDWSLLGMLVVTLWIRSYSVDRVAKQSVRHFVVEALCSSRG